MQGRAVGALFLELDGRNQTNFAAALELLRQRASEAEALGHVVDDD